MRTTSTLLVILVIFMTTIVNAQTQPERIGYLGGTFDPPTLGHLSLVKRAIEQGRLDKVYVLSVLTNTHKPNMSPFQHRRAMVELNFANEPKISVSDVQLEYAFSQDRATGVMRELMQRHPGAKILRITGDDVVSRNLTTHMSSNPEFKDIGLIIGERGGSNVLIAEDFRKMDFEGREVVVISAESDNGYSSSWARYDVRVFGKTELLKPTVSEYIQLHKLYVPSEPSHCEVWLRPAI